MPEQRRAGTIAVQVNGEVQDAAGEFTYNLGRPKRSAMVGADSVHGYMEEPQVAFIEGTLRDRRTLDVAKLAEITNATITLQLANGKVIVLRDAWFAGEGNVTTREALITVRFEGASAEEIQ